MRVVLLALVPALAGACASEIPSSPSSAGSSPRVLVLLREASGDGSPDARISVAGPHSLLEHPSGRSLSRGGPRALTAREWTAGGRYACRLIPEDAPIRVNDRAYEGTLLLLPDGDRVRLVLDTDVERYLPGVLAGELSADFPPAALRAQAIASRTYALHRVRECPPDRAWHVTDDSMSQVFRGAVPEEVFHAAVEDTRGMALLWSGRPLPAYFHSTCGGHTAAAHEVFGGDPVPPLLGTPCDFCRISRFYSWKTAIPIDEATRALGIAGPLRAARVCERDRSGRALRLEFAGDPVRSLSAVDARSRLGPARLYSTLIHDLAVGAGTLEISGAGWGHGVGMCQMGAKGIALAGGSTADILAHYYPGAGLFRLY